MSTTRRCGLSRPGPYSLCLLLASLSLLSACVSSPEAPASEAPVPETPSAGPAEPPPEAVEIRGPVPLPVRMVLVLPDPELPALPGAASRTPPPAAPAREAAVVAGESSIPVPEPPAPAAATPVPAESGPKSPETPKPAPSPAAAKPAEPKPSAAAAVPAAPAPSTASPAAPAAPALALPPAPGSSARTVPEAAPEPGRTEEAVRGSPLELPMGGSGWVFLGETGGREGLKYESRKFDGSRAVFQFTAERPGEYLLRFQRQDPFSGDLENLIVKVIVREPEPPAAAGSPSRAVPGAAPAGTPASGPAAAAPASGSSASDASAPASSRAGGLPPAAADPASGAVPPEAAPAAVAPSPPVPRDLPSTPEELLRLAREDLAAARIAGVLEVLDRYMALFPFGSDEAHYLYAKAYEQNTPYRDIKKAYANYRKVRDEWPRSPFWRESAERVTYIERHYFDIR